MTPAYVGRYQPGRWAWKKVETTRRMQASLPLTCPYLPVPGVACPASVFAKRGRPRRSMARGLALILPLPARSGVVVKHLTPGRPGALAGVRRGITRDSPACPAGCGAPLRRRRRSAAPSPGPPLKSLASSPWQLTSLGRAYGKLIGSAAAVKSAVVRRPKRARSATCVVFEALPEVAGSGATPE